MKFQYTMKSKKSVALALGLAANTTVFLCLPTHAAPNRTIDTSRPHALSSTNEPGIWNESPILSQAFDQLIIRNWTSINETSREEWRDQISTLALSLAAKEASGYITREVQKFLLY